MGRVEPTRSVRAPSGDAVRHEALASSEKTYECWTSWHGRARVALKVDAIPLSGTTLRRSYSNQRLFYSESRGAPSCTLWTGTGLASRRPDIDRIEGSRMAGASYATRSGRREIPADGHKKRRSRRARLLRMVGHYMRGAGILAASHAFCILSFDLGRRPAAFGQACALPSRLAEQPPDRSLHD